jgi:hypothetical protein
MVAFLNLTGNDNTNYVTAYCESSWPYPSPKHNKCLQATVLRPMIPVRSVSYILSALAGDLVVDNFLHRLLVRVPQGRPLERELSNV